MNKIVKAITAVAASVAIAATTIGSSAYNGNATDYNCRPLSLKTTVNTNKGLLVNTQAQRDMYPTFSMDDLSHGYFFWQMREAGYQQMVLGQRHMGIYEYAQKVGAVCAIFEYDEGSGKWPGIGEDNGNWIRSLGSLSAFEKFGYNGVFNEDNVHWVQALTFAHIPKGTSVAFAKPSVSDLSLHETPIVAYVEDKQPEIMYIYKVYPGIMSCTMCGDIWNSEGNAYLMFIFDGAYAGIDMRVNVDGTWYDAYCCEAHPAECINGTHGSMTYCVNIPSTIELANICGIRITNAAGQELLRNPALNASVGRNLDDTKITINYKPEYFYN